MNVLSIANYAHKLDNDTEYSLTNKVESSKSSSNVSGIDTEKIMQISSYIQNSVKIVIEKIKTIFKGN